MHRQPSSLLRVKLLVVAIVRLWRARYRLAHVPSLTQVCWMAGVDGHEPRSYLLDREVNWLPPTLPDRMERQLGRPRPVAHQTRRVRARKVVRAGRVPRRLGIRPDLTAEQHKHTEDAKLRFGYAEALSEVTEELFADELARREAERASHRAQRGRRAPHNRSSHHREGSHEANTSSPARPAAPASLCGAIDRIDPAHLIPRSLGGCGDAAASPRSAAATTAPTTAANSTSCPTSNQPGARSSPTPSGTSAARRAETHHRRQARADELSKIKRLP